MLASLFDAAPEAFRNIALLAVLSTPLGPPRELLSLSLLCHASHRILSSAKLSADIFTQKFDVKWPLARLGTSTFQENSRLELQRRFSALKIFRRGHLNDPSLTEAFWIAYLMIEDSDTNQKNVKQLLWAGLLGFLDSFIRHRLYQGSDRNHGWPLPNEQNSLAVALFWLSSSQTSVNRETAELRDEMLRALAPFVFAAFRYPTFSNAESCFDVTNYIHQATGFSIHGPYPPAPILPRDALYFGQVSRKVRVPSASIFAALLFFTRQETLDPAIPPHLIAARRQTREVADALQQVGPTLDDIEHFIHRCRTKFADFPATDVGVMERGTTASLSSTMESPALYKVGTLTGSWQGSYIMPYLENYKDWLGELDVPSIFPTTGRFPLYVTLTEHFTCDVSSVIPRIDTQEGTMNAWLPLGFQWVEKDNGIEVSDQKGTFKAFYETFRRGGDNIPAHNVVDVIITGKTDRRHAAAWGNFHILGRVRLVDGLMVVSRKPVNNTGTTLLRGYVTSSQNLVGRFKGVSNGTQPAGWEAAFSLCKDLTYHD